jgi:uncharacterized protein
VVSVNVAQLLLSPPGEVREFDFSEPFQDPSDDLHLCGPIAGHARLMRTSEGVLVTTKHSAPVALECARCLNDVQARIEGTLEEEFLPSFDIHTGLPTHTPGEDDQPRIDEHHEIDLDEVLRQNMLTNLPLQPLCEAACPGLCPTCGERLDARHATHPEGGVPDSDSPFARLAPLLNDLNAEER